MITFVKGLIAFFVIVVPFVGGVMNVFTKKTTNR